MAIGRIKIWNSGRGFGFIATESSKGQSPDVYVHISQIDYRPVQQGDIVTFDLQFDAHGRPRASNVKRAEPGACMSIWEDLPEVRSRKAREIFSEALISRDEKNYPKARHLFQEAIRLDPQKNFFDAFAAMEKQLGNWDRVRAIYTEARQYFPHDVSVLENLAMAERRAGNLERCVEILRDALRDAPNQASLHIHLAQALVELAEKLSLFNVLNEAKEHFRLAQKLQPYLNIDKRSHFHQMWFLHQRRSRIAWLFFKQSGFSFSKWRVNLTKRGEPIDAWLIVDPRSYRYADLFSLDGLVFVYCNYGRGVTESVIKQAEDHLREILSQIPLVKPDLLFIVLPETGPVLRYLKLLLEDPENHPTVVPLEEERVEDLLNDQEAVQGYLEQLLSAWVFRRDLYKGNFPVSGRRFFGREREIGILNQSIEEGRSVGIFGLRKSGKTSLLYQVKLIRTKDLCAYIDPEASPISDCAWLCWKAIQEWGNQLKQSVSKLRLLQVNSPPIFQQALIDFDVDLRTLMNTVSPEAKLVLMIDEIEKVVPPFGSGWANSLEFFRFIRGIAQQSSGKLTVFISGANPAICETAQWQGEDNPVFQFFEEMFLPLLPEKECKEMVVTLGRGMGVEWEDDALRMIYWLTGGHPYITRKACSILVNKFSERPLRITPEMVQETETLFLIRLGDVFNEIKERLQREHRDEWEILEGIVSGFSLNELKQLIPTWARALRHLEGYQLLDLSGPQPVFKIELLYKWLKEEEGSDV
ncbi:MAG: cold shock domain-containing protein [Nitrososphaerota archaeon]